MIFFFSGDLQFTSNATHPLTLEALDASELANFSSSEPVYELINPAQYAEILVKKDQTGNVVMYHWVTKRTN